MNCPDGWVSLYDAAPLMWMHHNTLRKLIREGHFTRLQLRPYSNAAIHVLRKEVEIYRKGGLESLAAHHARKSKKRKVRS